MKNACLILSAVLMTAISVSSCSIRELASQEKEGAAKEVVSFEEVTIGNQTWMTQNLNVDKFRNGEPIPQAKTDEEWEKAGADGKPAWCYYDNDPKNGAKYGKLYNWYAVNDSRGLAPTGCHIPTDAEWTILSDYLGGEVAAGKKMKSTSGWNDEGNGRNSSGFSGLPGGTRYGSGYYYYVGSLGYWWSASEGYTDYACFRSLYTNDVNLGRYDNSKEKGLSVRCLRD